jgi:enamine deaminase RidA (YjgF/YER057c/UK114 family)
MTVTHVNPDSLHKNPAFSQATIVEGGRTMYIGGQNGTDATGAIVPGGARAQAEQALRNVLAILESVGATQANVARLNVFYHRDADLAEIFAASNDVWGNHPTGIVVLQVYALGRPDALLEIDAVVGL